MSIVKWMYVCMSSICGYVELSKFAPSVTKPCPRCGTTMTRRECHG